MIRVLTVLFIAMTRLAMAEQSNVVSGLADLVITNAKIYSPGNNHDSLAIKSNRILAVGSETDIKTLVGPQTTQLNAKGCSVTPGFHDSHVHFLSGSIGLTQVDLADADSVGELEKRILAFIQRSPNEACIVGRGWVYGTFDGGLPSKAILDRIVPDKPAVMKCYDGHTLWVNTRALQAANITRDTPDPEGGIIVRDPVTMEPTGVLKEAAQTLMDNVIPKPTRSDKLSSLRKGMAEAHRFGITSVFDAGVDREELELYESLRATGELNLRFTFALTSRRNISESDANQLTALRREFPRLDIPAVKLFVDGVIESHTAVMLADYANKTSRGLPETSQEDLNRIIELLDRRGWQIVVHAIGDGGIRMTLDAIERAQQLNPVPSTPRRHRLEHIESISQADIGRFGPLGVIASMQPYHANPNSNIFGVWAANLGSDRASRAWVWKSIQDAGGVIAFGSDWPVVSLDPRLGMHTALTRQTLQGKPDEGFLSSQRLPLAPVLNAYTYGSAFAENEEGQKGALVAGSLADVVIWDRDLFSLPVDQVHTANVRMTILDGRVVFQQKEPGCLQTSLFDTKSDSPALIPKCIRTKPTIRFRKSKLYLR
ncbi:MAG: amidohydrolase [Planctomycetota bacterium]|nr:amidohydrolase [Planctomycetota bacterium]